MAVPRKGFLSASGCHAPTDATEQQEGRRACDQIDRGAMRNFKARTDRPGGKRRGARGCWAPWWWLRGVKRRGYSPWAKAAASARLRCTEPGPLATRKFCGLAQRAGRDACGGGSLAGELAPYLNRSSLQRIAAFRPCSRAILRNSWPSGECAIAVRQNISWPYSSVLTNPRIS